MHARVRVYVCEGGIMHARVRVYVYVRGVMHARVRVYMRGVCTCVENNEQCAYL